MKFSLDSATLLPLLDIATRFVSKNTTLPILQNSLIIVEPTLLTIKSTDMEKYSLTTTPLTGATPGSLTVNTKTLYDVCTTIQTGMINFSYNADKDTLVIKTAKDTFSLKTLPASDYVALPSINEPQRIPMLAADFARGVEKVSFAIQEKAFTPIFTGVYLRSKKTETGQSLYFVGTDTFLLTEYIVPYTEEMSEEFSVIIPKSACLDIAYVARQIAEQKNSDGSTNDDAQCTLLLAKNLLGRECTLGETTITISSIILQGNFPDYTNPKIMPVSYESRYQLDTRTLEKELRKVSILAKDNKNFVVLTYENDGLTLSTGKTDKGDGTVVMDILSVEGTPAQTYLNTKYLSEISKIVQGPTIQIRLNGSLDPLVIKDDGDENHTCVVRPVQI